VVSFKSLSLFPQPKGSPREWLSPREDLDVLKKKNSFAAVGKKKV